MEKMMVFDAKAKTRLGLLCALPPLTLLGCVLYYLYLISPTFTHAVEPSTAVAYTKINYDTMLIVVAIHAVIAAAVLIYNIVILARLKNINSAVKLMWLIILCAFAPVSSIFFWFFLIKNEPKYVPIHPSIA